MGFVDVSSDLFVELLKGLGNTDEPKRFIVSEGVPEDAIHERFEVRDGGQVLRVWFKSETCNSDEQFTPLLTVAR